ncbi:MAG TPA: beta-L-arabinofuranosidase domain-containing protein [Thermomicrobiales bacterium]|nr:beta-L-arabinofuranosidase domain-containing protein [Thermomicrobiales bacterium]
MTQDVAGPALLRRELTPLPLGSVRPTGWLRRQLQIQAGGLSGHLDEFWPDIAESAWIGGDAEGWERGPYWLDGVVPLAFLIADERLLAKVRHWIDYILDHQHDDGWFGTEADKRISNPRDLRIGRASHSYQYDPWPRFILLKALTQYQEATGDERIVPAIERFLRRLHELSGTYPLRSWARYRWADLVVTIHWLHDRTGEPWLLDLAARMHEQGFDWRTNFARLPVRDRVLREERDLSTHVVNNAMGIKTAGVWYRQSGDTGDREAVRQGIEMLDRHHGQATGVFSGDEHLAGRSPSQGTELCAVVEYLYSLEVLLPILGNAWLADRLEQIAFNALPATFTPDMWAHQYVQQVNQVICAVEEDRIYTSNGPDANIYGLEPNFGCCTADMHQGWPKFAAHLWMGTPDGGLAAVAWAPALVETELGGRPVRIEVDTSYPFNGDIRITVQVEQPARFPIDLRVPSWANGATVRIGDGDEAAMAPGGFHRLEREWSGSTELHVNLPMRVRLEPRDDGSISIHRGPLLLALPIGEEWRQVGGEVPHADWEVRPTTSWNYALVLPGNALESTRFEETALGEYPFSPDGAPVSMEVQGRRVSGWEIEHNAAAPVPDSPSTSTSPVETLRLIPYGATNLRIAQFPVVTE